MTDAPTLQQLAATVEDARGVEQLSRGLLEATGDLTGLASAYVSVVHEDEPVSTICFAHNAGEGLELSEGGPAPRVDTGASRSIGIVHVSVPIELADGTLWGRLGAADRVVADDAETHLPTLRLFARLIAAEVERDAAARLAMQEADTDALTGCGSRRVVQPWLTAQLSSLTRDEVVVAAYVDLDDFHGLNDTYGEAAGDAVLVEVGRRLRGAARGHDLIARLSGDEFLLAARVPRSAALLLTARVRSALAFSMFWNGASVGVHASVGVAVSDGHDGPSLVAAADVAMYALKQARVAAS